MSTSANGGDVLAGEYCVRCGWRATSLHRPVQDLASDAVRDVLDLDTRLVHTLRPPLLTSSSEPDVS